MHVVTSHEISRTPDILDEKSGKTRWLNDRYSPAATRLYCPGDWPQIGGQGASKPLEIWDDPVVHSRFKPYLRISVAVLACPGLYGCVARPLHMPVYKISTTIDSTQTLHKRLHAINRDDYGAWWRSSSGWHHDEGFDDWFLTLTEEVASISPHSPVKLATRGLHVLLPEGMTPRAFDIALKNQLESARLDKWVQTDAAGMHAQAVNADLDKARRYTTYDLSSETPRRSLAEELVIFKPAKQTDQLVGIVEKIILKWQQKSSAQ